MPIQHARKAARRDDLACLKRPPYGLKHREALKFLTHPDDEERRYLLHFLAEYVDVRTYADAVALLTELQNAPVPIHVSGCPSGCPECGADEEYENCSCDDPDRNADCYECGAGGSGDPYGECTCYYEDDQESAAGAADDEDYDKFPPRNDPEPPDDYYDDQEQDAVPAGGWGSQ
ncbi:hypothetical protein ACIO3O_36845 [Streptomyces sp. NPDC087440]|uniref:hypothetical protein n=1 Tax=Streptomyces sp. NPDC087440 TaxID=3365790 RepID=UPI00381CA16A